MSIPPYLLKWGKLFLVRPLWYVLKVVFIVLKFLMPYVLPVVAGFGLAYYLYLKEKQRAIRRISAHNLSVIDRAGLDQLLKAGIKADELLDNVPAWVRYAEFEKVTWINTFLRGLWPFLDKAVCEEIRTQVDPILKENCPSFLKSITFKKLTIGQEYLPQLTGIKITKEPTEINCEIKLSWGGDPVIVIGIETLAGVTLEVSLKNIHLFAHPRVLLKPLVNKIPCFSAMSISLMEPPKIDYDLNTFGIPITSIPGLAEFLEGFIGKILCDMLLWPQRMVIPIIKDEEGNILNDPGDLEKRPVGTLFVRLAKAESLKPPSLELSRVLSAMEVFVVMKLGPTRKAKSKAKQSSKKVNPEWDETFQILVESPETEILEVGVYAKDSLATKAIKVGSASEGTCLGALNIPLKDLGNNKKTEKVYALKERKTSAAEKLKEGGVLLGTSSALIGGAGKLVGGASKSMKKVTGGERTASIEEQEDLGTLELALLYRPYRRSSSLRSKSTLSENSDGEAATENGAKEEEEEDNEDFKHFCGTTEGGSLHVKIMKAYELAAVTANPYVSVTFGPSCKFKTDVRQNTLNPVFDYSKSINVNTDELLSQDLCLEVKSRNSIKSNTSLGKVTIPLKEIIREGRMQDILFLKNVKTGKLEVELTWTGY